MRSFRRSEADVIAPNSSDSPAAESTEPAEKPQTPVRTWPEWVKSVDVAIAGLVLTAAFMTASYVARNSDQWLHYASGRALVNGTYTFGTDPFSLAPADRVWVNHSWLADLGMYYLYISDPTGFVIVVIKAFFIAAAFGIVLLIRKSGTSIWPWVLPLALAVIATVQMTILRPFVLNAVFLASLLFLVFGRDWRSGALINFIAIGFLSWLWASCDSFFLLGPLTIGIVLLGELIQSVIRKEENEEGMASVSQLALALLISVVASSLTPHHVRVWQLPVELGLTLPANYRSDNEISGISFSPIAEKYLKSSSLGWNENGLAFAGLMIGGGIVLAIGFARLRLAHLLLWLAFAGLALIHFRLILLFCVVAIPIFGRALAGLVDRISLGNPDSPRAKLLLMLSGVGRIIAFPFALLLVAAAYPGWLHPKPSHKALTHRCNWRVEADAGLQRTAELLRAWRDDGKLTSELKGMCINIDLANHIAWFAPGEKVFVNSRFEFHRHDLEEFIKSRKLFLYRRTDEPIPQVEISNFREFCQQKGITYVVYCGIGSPPGTVDLRPLTQLSSFEGNYSLWHVDGRCAIIGDRGSPQYDLKTFSKLAFNPIRYAFNPETVQSIPTPRDFERKMPLAPTLLDDFILDLPKPPPLEALDAIVWNEIAVKHAVMDFYYKTRDWPLFAAAVGNPLVASIVQERGYRADDYTTAYHILALRAAYQAIAANPDYPDSYFMLAQAGGIGRGSDGSGVPSGIPGLTNEFKKQMETCGLRLYLDLAPPPEASNFREIELGYHAAIWLHELYQPTAFTQAGQSNLPEPALQMFALAERYFPYTEIARSNPKQAEAILKQFKAQTEKIEDLIIPANRELLKYKTQPLGNQIRAAINFRLLNQAIAKFKEGWPDQLGTGLEVVDLTVQMVGVYIQIGQLDEADLYLREVEMIIENLPEDARNSQAWIQFTQIATFLRGTIGELRGDYSQVGDGIERQLQSIRMPITQKPFVERAAKLPDAQSFNQFFLSSYYLAPVGGLGIPLQGEIQAGIQTWRMQADLFLQRGILLALEGKIAEARVRFQQALNPEKIPLPYYMPQQAVAEQYLRMIDEASNK